MGSPISGLIAEIFLHHHEQHILKNILDSKMIRLYHRYVDDILIIYYNTKNNIVEITILYEPTQTPTIQANRRNKQHYTLPRPLDHQKTQ